MFVLSKEPNKAELLAQMDQECLLGKEVVTVSKDEKYTQSGSYDRGLKFHTTTYVMLIKGGKDTAAGTLGRKMSFDYGKTWEYSRMAAYKSAGRAKVMLKRDTHKEFAFDSIQKINRDYYGPSYKW